MILLTGCSGFVGRHVLPELLRHYPAEEITVLIHQHVPGSVRDSGIRMVYGGLATIMQQCDEWHDIRTIVHLAGKNRDDDDKGYEQVNVEGTRDIIRLGKALSIDKLIYISSTGVYGRGNFYEAEERKDRRPDTAFSKSKCLAEDLLRESGLPVVILRHRFLIGEGDKYVIPGFIEAFRKLPVLPRGGSTIFSFVDVDDMAKIIVHMAGIGGVRGCEEYHVTNGEKVSISGVFQVISELFSLKGRRRLSVPFYPLYLGLRLREKLLGINPESKDAKGLNSLRLCYLGLNNHFSNKKLKAVLPDLVFKTFGESMENARNYYERYV